MIAAQVFHAGTMQQQLLSGEARADQHDREPEPGRKRSWISHFFINSFAVLVAGLSLFLVFEMFVLK